MTKVRVLKKPAINVEPKNPHRRVITLTAAVCVVALVLSAFFLITPSSVSADDFNFGTENVTKGTSMNPTGRNTEDGTYNTLEEADQYTDTNFSGTTENVVTGTAGGGAFPGSLDTDDASRRSYTEASSGGGSPSIQVLRPTSDGSVTTMVEYPVSPTTHWDKVDETDVGGDGDTTYLEGVTNAQESELGMSDPSDPGGSPNIDVTMWHISRGETTSGCTVAWGIEIGGVEYQGGSTTMTSITYANFSYTWTIDPSDSQEWTLADVNALECYIRVTDANPDTRTTQVGLVITFTPVGTYTLDAQITYSSVTVTSQTTGYKVFCQGYRSASENFLVNAWDYTLTQWNLKATVNSASDTDFDFTLTSDERDGTNNEVKLQIKDADSDGVEDTVYFDVLKVQRIEEGYALDIDMTCTVAPEYGNITLRIKGYTSAEQFNVNVWNYSSSGYDAGKLAITSLSNSWQTTVDLVDASHRSGQNVKVQFTDNTVASADTIADSLYLDVLWLTRYYTDPTITLYGAVPFIVGEGQAIGFFGNYTDYDNSAPSFFYVNIDTADYSLSKNDSGDVSYHNGVNYSLSKSDLTLGEHTYYFRTQDANSGVITTASAKVYVNDTPTLSGDTVIPPTGNAGESFRFEVIFTDADGDMPSYVKARIDSTDYDCLEDDVLDLDTTDGKEFYYNKVMSGGDHTYQFKAIDAYNPEVVSTEKNLHVNNLPALSGYGRTPADPVYVTTDLNFTVTFTDADNDLPTSIKWRENGGAIQNVSMVQVDPYDLTTSDGKDYCLFNFNLGHGTHDYDHYASDSGGFTTGGSNSITIVNRAPTIDNKFVDDHEWRNTYWEFDYAYTDLDGDSVVFEMSTNGSFLNINSASGLVYGTTSDPVGWYETTVWCNDSYSGSDSDSFILYVDNRVPIITNGPGSDPATYRNTAWQYDFDHSDADGDSVGWEKSGEAWLTIGGTGLISGTTPDAPGNYGFTVWCNDSYGGSDDYSFTLHVNNRIPVISSSGNTTQVEGTYLAYHILASDDDGDVLTYELSTNASWATISGQWVNGTATGVGWYDFTIWVNDSYSGSDSEDWDLTVLSSNQAPYFTSTPIYTVANNSAYSYDANATDPDDPPDPVTYGLTTNCSWLEINPSTGVVSGTPHKAGSYYVNVTADDGTNPPAYQNFSLAVTSAAPSFTSSPIDEWQNNTFYSYQALVDDPENEYLNFSLEGNATGFLSVHQYQGYVNGTIPYVGWYLVNISVFDGTNYVWQNFTLYSLNTAPSITTSPGLTGAPGVEYSYNADATDVNSDTLEWAATEKPVWLVVDPVTGECTGIPVIEGNYDVKLVVWDGLAYDWQNWTIVVTIPSEPPVVPPADDKPSPGESNPMARFEYTIVNNKIILKDTTMGQVTRRQWDFGDGTGSQQASVTHTYLQPGDYTIVLTVWNGQYKSVAQVTLHIGSADEWRVERGESGWEVHTPAGSLQLDAVLCLMLGSVILIISYAGQKLPLPKILTVKTVKIIGLVLVILGMTFYAL